MHDEITELRYHIVNRFIRCMRFIETEPKLRKRLNWVDNNKIIGELAYSLHNISDFSDSAFRGFDDTNRYRSFILSSLVDHLNYLENDLLPELERRSLDIYWLIEYQEEMAEIKNVLDNYSVDEYS
ncbi:hypothetical protein [Leuconostoc citreum]